MSIRRHTFILATAILYLSGCGGGADQGLSIGADVSGLVGSRLALMVP